MDEQRSHETRAYVGIADSGRSDMPIHSSPRSCAASPLGPLAPWNGAPAALCRRGSCLIEGRPPSTRSLE